MMTKPPVTFTEPCYLLFDIDQNAVLTTEFGNLAVWSTKGMADVWKSRSAKNLKVRAVRIVPIDMNGDES